MSEQRDPRLESLFAVSQEELVDEVFTSGVLARLKARGHRALIGRVTIFALIVALELLLDSPLQNSVGAVTQMLGTTLFEIDHEWLAFVVAPLNSIAGLIGMTLLGLHFIFRRIFF